LQVFCAESCVTLGTLDFVLATGWTVRGSNAGGGKIFRTRPDRLRGLPRLPSYGYWVFPGSKAAGAWCWSPTTI